MQYKTRPEANTTATGSLTVAFVGAVVPDQPMYRTEAFFRAGNQSQTNVLLALHQYGLPVSRVVSFVPIPSFPGARRLYVRSKDGIEIAGIRSTTLLPFINVMPLKFLHLGLGVFIRLIWWSRKHRNSHRLVHLYNVSRPPGLFAYAAARMTGARVSASLYDVGIPGQGEVDTPWQRLSYRMTRWLVPRLDGRVVITPGTERDFARGQPCLVVDGAVSEQLLERFSSCRGPVGTAAECVFMLAGSLWEGNGVRLVLDAFRRVSGPRRRLLIAGRGELEPLVHEAAALDTRIQFFGNLDMPTLLDLYEKSDILLNIRLTQAARTPYNFPSKFHEQLATGRLVISTPAVHIRDEYDDFCLLLHDESVEDLSMLMERAASMSPMERTTIGLRAREYMRSRKTWAVQGRRMADYLLHVATGDVPITVEK